MFIQLRISEMNCSRRCDDVDGRTPGSLYRRRTCDGAVGRLFGARCAKCGVSFGENDLVMRARQRIYHVECFQCVVCQRRLVAGDEFCQRGDDDLVCKDDSSSAATIPRRLEREVCKDDLPSGTTRRCLELRVCKDDFDAVVDCRVDSSTGGSTAAGFSPFDDSSAHEHNNNNNNNGKADAKS